MISVHVQFKCEASSRVDRVHVSRPLDADLSIACSLPPLGCRWNCRRYSSCCFHSQMCLDPEVAAAGIRRQPLRASPPKQRGSVDLTEKRALPARPSSREQVPVARWPPSFSKLGQSEQTSEVAATDWMKRSYCGVS